jgi:glutamine synthetase
VAAEAFGPAVHHHLVNTARQEWDAANRVVTDWELARNFERI